MKIVARLAISLIALGSPVLLARGVSPYLPLDLEPELERQIERVLILADKPILKRPIAAATVLDALPRACRIDFPLCQQVRHAIERHMHSSGLTHVGVEAGSGDSEGKSIANRRGLLADDELQVSLNAYWQPSDYVLLSIGGVAHGENSIPTGTLLSVGMERAQLDIGYRGHWLSPMTDSAMLISTNAAEMPSVTLSNFVPLTRFGLHYEAFLAHASRSDLIAFQGGFTSGTPRIAGLHLSMEPASGWALSLNRVMQYGGGARGGDALGDLINAFFRPSRFDNTNSGLSEQDQFGNQVAAVTSRFLFPGATPFAVYFEYAGEDTSHGLDYQLGNSALSAGIHFPRLPWGLELVYELSEWQNGWYINSVYGDGLSNEGHVLGHWGGDERSPGDAVGARSQMLRLGVEPPFGGYLQLRYRSLSNEAYSGVSYERAYDASLRYSRSWKHLTFGGEALGGRDSQGASFSRFAAFVHYSGSGRSRTAGDIGGAEATSMESGTHRFVEVGIGANRVEADLSDAIPKIEDSSSGVHFAIGARRAVSARSDLGARLEIDDVAGRTLLSVRALDYRYRMRSPLAFSFFLGASRYDLATPAYGLYGGIGAQWRDLLPGFDLGVDLRFASDVARDHLLPEDPTGPRPDSFYDVFSAVLFVSRRF
jgi:hypothetical protein